MTEKQFHVVDNLLPNDVHRKLYDHIKRLHMTNDWSSLGDKNQAWHWNSVFHNSKQYMPAMDEEQYNALSSNHPAVAELWNHVDDAAVKSVGKLNALRIYMNCNPYGTNGYIHKDDGDITAVYYANPEWDPEWEGGTCFYEEQADGFLDATKYVSYKPNRLVLFEAKTSHRAMPVDRLCKIPRYIIAMKLQYDVDDPSYFEKFYAKK
jgi:Rps23 Pro-64 3,4-dihydroxylase Tpa1-like proline 4-hydroxylase